MGSTLAATGNRYAAQILTASLIAASLSVSAVAANAETSRPVELSNLSIEELGNIQVTSVSKRAEPLSAAASAIFVITHEDIARSGATSIPEILRLAPNLQVTQQTASGYVITARGFNGNPGAQSFSNKLLVLIDGRSVYSPLFSGVYWDMQDVLPQNIERIEVISGPGATLWGANAVNGVINIITRASNLTQGGLVDVTAGDREHDVALRYGGQIGDNLSYRVQARAVKLDDTMTAAGAKAGDNWSRLRGGFRIDWAARSTDLLTLQGDAYRGSEAQLGAGDENIAGRDLVARWNHTTQAGSDLQVQAYYDRAERATEGGGGKFTVNTYNLEAQDSLSLGERHQIVWGAGLRTSQYRITGTPTFFFVPAAGNLNLSSLFAQDNVTLTRSLRLTVGLKVEDDPYVTPEPLPNLRLAWSPSDATTLWAAASKAVRAPTPFDRDVVEKLGPAAPPQLIGDAQFQHEKLTAYEAGGRFQPSPVASLTVSAFYNQYDQLRTIELSPGRKLPLLWGNLLAGSTYGAEAWGEYKVQPWWRLSAGVSTLRENLKFKPGATGIVGLKQDGQDPKYQASVKSAMDLGQSFTLDGTLRYVSALPNPSVPAYLELDGRVGWKLNDRLELSLSGRNLLHDRHVEYVGGNAIPRTAYIDLQWRF